MRIAILVLTLLLCAVSAHADRDPDAEIAHGHFTRARSLFERGEYRASLAEFEAARKAKRLAAFDFNIGRCNEELGQIDDAIAAYEEYLSKTVGQDAAEVRQHVEELKRRPRAAVTATAPQPASPPRKGGAPVAPAVVAGAAAVTLIIGSALYGSVAPDYDHLQESCAPRCERSTWRGLEQRTTAAYALWGVTGALVVADAVLWGLWARQRRLPQRAWRVAPSYGMGIVGATF